jgi:hypothetical protein
MTVRNGSPSPGSHTSTALRTMILRLLPAGLLGVAAALLVSCGGSSNKLIPLANAGPLQSDFEEVAQAAQTGNGSCAGTEAAILKTEQDFAALPSTIDAGLRNTLRQGISNLRSRALVLCAQPLAPTTVTSTTPKTTTSTHTTPTTPAVTPTTTTPTATSTTPTTPAPSGPGGGTPAPGAGEPQPEAGSGQGGGTGVGESGAGGAPGAGASPAGPEGGK